MQILILSNVLLMALVASGVIFDWSTDFVVVGSVVEGRIIFDCVVVGCGTLAVNIVDEVMIECVYVVVFISSGFGVG